METKKEEVIRKAYGEYWERLPKKIKEEIFLLDGWLDWLSLNDISLGLLWLEIRNSLDVNIDSDKDRLRPKSLQGIENNNGCTISKLSDLPTEGILTLVEKEYLQKRERERNFEKHREEYQRQEEENKRIVEEYLVVDYSRRG